MRIDAHHHFWQLSEPFDYGWLNSPKLSAIRRDFLPQDLAPLLAQHQIDRSIVVQTQHNVEETRWMLRLAEENEFLAGVVGWIDLASPRCEEQLSEFLDHPKFVGIRHVTQDEPDDDFIIRPEIQQGLAVLEKHQVPFDLLFYVKHLKHAATLARKFPKLPLVIDHLAKPNIEEGKTDNWLPEFGAAAQYPNVYCKLSGMITEASWDSWTPADLKPYVETALELFGPKRCMYGSDWPVCLTAGSYDRVYAALAENLTSLSPSEQQEIFGGTAKRFYRLEESSSAS